MPQVKVAHLTELDVKTLLNQHTSIESISNRLKVNKSTIYLLLNKFDLKSPYKNKEYFPVYKQSLSIPSKEMIEETLSNASSVNQAAKKIGVVHETFKKWMIYYGIEHKTAYKRTAEPKRKFSLPSKDELLKLEDHHKSWGKIANHLNVSWATINNWFNHYGLDARYKHHKGPSKFKIDVPDRATLWELYHDRQMSQTDVALHFGISNGTVKKWFLSKDIPLRKHSDNQKLISVPKFRDTCMERYGIEGTPFTFHSKGELEVLNFLNSNGFNFASNRKILGDSRELDGYDPNINIAFEYCGLYYHSGFTKSGVTLKKCHIEKQEEAKKNGIRLFTIFEHEWRDRQFQVKAYLMGALGKYKRRLNARDCTIETNVSKDVVRDFMNEWHIQGAPAGFDLAICLYGKPIAGVFKELLGVVTFSKHHRQGFEDVAVLNRLCWKEGVSVIGGAKRMLHHAKKHYDPGKKIVTWSDNRWSDGGLYERLGFVLETEYGPDYFYTDKNGNVASKQSKQKKHLKALPHETEEIAAKRQGWERIYDCGKKKWTMIV